MRIPNLVHFVFGLVPQIEPFHPVHYLAIESCRRAVQPERILFHYVHEPYGTWWDLARPNVDLVRLPDAPELPDAAYADGLVPERYRYAHQADFVRLDVLIKHGGVYADIDTLFLRPFPDRLRRYPFVIGREGAVRDERTGERRPSLCNALMMAEPGSAFARAWREDMAAALDGTWSNHSGFLAAELARRLPAHVHVEPRETFVPFSFTPDGIEALLARCEHVPAAAVSVHLWAHLWWEPSRRDFSDVHAGSLTPRRIRRRDTTYNLLARPLLPALPLEDAARRIGHVRYQLLHEVSGYGTAARRLILALDAAGVDLDFTPMTRTAGDTMYEPHVTNSLEDPELDPLLADAREPDVVVGHTTPEYYPLLRSAYPRAKLVGHTVWETERLPRHWPDLMETTDLLVVPTRWNAETIRADGVSAPVAVVPHVAAVPRRRRSPTWDAIPSDVFAFYTIASWSSRKAIERTIRAYLEAFREGEPVVLIVKTSQLDFSYVGPRATRLVQPGTTAWTTAQVLKDYPRPAPVKLVTRDLDEQDIEALHTRGDCFVSLCRSEGWGIPSFDAAAYGNPVVITGYGGQLEYLDPDRAHLVAYSVVEVHDPTGLPSYTPDQRWAEPSIDHAAELLRHVYEHRAEAQDRARELSREILLRYSPEAVGEEFIRALDAADPEHR